MPLQTTRRLPAVDIKDDRETLWALKKIVDYAPANPAHTVEALTALSDRLDQAEQAKRRAKETLDAARNQAIEAAWALHDALVGARAQVFTQYGPYSLEIKAVGLTRKSERKWQ